MCKFILGVSELVVKECHTIFPVYDTDISRLMFHSQQIKQDKIKENSKEPKSERTEDNNSYTLGLVDVVIEGFEKGFPGKVTIMFLQDLTKVWCLTLNLKEVVVGHHCQIVLRIEESIKVNVQRVPILILSW